MEVYKSFDHNNLATAWNQGNLDIQTFAEALVPLLHLPADAIVARMIERCHEIQFYDQTYTFFKARHLPQAIVTVNPDLFSEVIVPVYNLNTQCDMIVTSWEEGTEDKRILNRLAIERMEVDCVPGEALLIDNKLSNVKDWVDVGGAGYHYQGDQQFIEDAADGIDALASMGPWRTPTQLEK